ncbi:outer envelope pore protein 37 [Pyrus ussuriensis x Pyrus communis]|uniref:Outer envelope pore protein 37 n=1 Tax=Pyrus ussuriensis x Pyrus communis TaxID=2448454 RepID=A0A5N5GLL5_9ROSA|nr:outer envelope pore protein 37 [Pyrus ussuriensis x Pyrus communis]
MSDGSPNGGRSRAISPAVVSGCLPERAHAFCDLKEMDLVMQCRDNGGEDQQPPLICTALPMPCQHRSRHNESRQKMQHQSLRAIPIPPTVARITQSLQKMRKTSEGKKAENLRKEKVPWSKIVSATVSVKKQGIEMAFIALKQTQAAAEVALKLHFETDCRSSKALCEVSAAIHDGCAVLFETWKIQVFKEETGKHRGD